ncbi:hypothetical protein LTR49_025145 [Elasticomyces elasticus]|nr:hypothetical protein LTR49_025145 [Elasticomyces elasticus]
MSNPNTSALRKSQQCIFRDAENLALMTSNPIAKNIEQRLAPLLNSAIRTAIYLDLFNIICTPIALPTIAEKTTAGRTLLLRLLRVLCSHSYFEELSRETYQPTALSESLRSAPIRDWIKTTFDTTNLIGFHLPAYLASIQYQNPSSDVHSTSPSKFVFREEYFAHLHANPVMLEAFNSAMGIQDLVPLSSIPVFPFAERLSQICDDTVALVDVGGGHGSYLDSWRKAYPNLKGCIVLQDLPTVIDEINLITVDFELMAHDFFTPQPIVGARFYHFRRVLHDWSDGECTRILRNVAKGFSRDYSTLLLSEQVMPDEGCNKLEALTDWNMMALTGMERTRSQWSELLGAAGFLIRDVHMAQRGSRGIIEAQLADGSASA